MIRVFICLGCRRRRRLLHIGHVAYGKGFFCTACEEVAELHGVRHP